MMFPQGRRSTCAVLALTNLRKTIETTIDCFDEFFFQVIGEAFDFCHAESL